MAGMTVMTGREITARITGMTGIIEDTIATKAEIVITIRIVIEIMTGIATTTRAGVSIVTADAFSQPRSSRSD
jgi:hypothetical protein